jgi:hypothetical protein
MLAIRICTAATTITNVRHKTRAPKVTFVTDPIACEELDAFIDGAGSRT